jgi:hypothetical protein
MEKAARTIIIVVVVLGSLLLWVDNYERKIKKSDQLEVPFEIKLLHPEPKQVDYYDWWIKVLLNQKIAQDFKLEITPREKMSFKKSGSQMVWYFTRGRTWKPLTQYQVKLSSSDYFVYKNRIFKEISWSFKTANQEILNSQVEDLKFRIDPGVLDDEQ